MENQHQRSFFDLLILLLSILGSSSSWSLPKPSFELRIDVLGLTSRGKIWDICMNTRFTWFTGYETFTSREVFQYADLPQKYKTFTFLVDKQGLSCIGFALGIDLCSHLWQIWSTSYLSLFALMHNLSFVKMYMNVFVLNLNVLSVEKYGSAAN